MLYAFWNQSHIFREYKEWFWLGMEVQKEQMYISGAQSRYTYESLGESLNPGSWAHYMDIQTYLIWIHI